MATSRSQKTSAHPWSGFGHRLRTVRESLDLSQTDFAKSLNITGSYVSQLETGYASPPPAETVERICAKLKVGPSVKRELMALAQTGRDAWVKARGRGARRAGARANGAATVRIPANAKGASTEGLHTVTVRVPKRAGAELVAIQLVFERTTGSKSSR